MDDIQLDLPKVVHKDPEKQAFANILEFITNTFYRTDENNEISVQISKDPNSDNFYDTRRIVLNEGLIDAFGKLNIPRFIVYYHELGHHLYSQGYFKLFQAWTKIGQGSPIEYNKKYDHLANWIEDYYIEDKLIKEHGYLTDVITCLKKTPAEYDIKDIAYAFNFYYVHDAPTPALSYTDQVSFKAYIDRLLQMRRSNRTRFGHGVLSTLYSRTKSIETAFVELLIEFHGWCVARKILPKDNPMPALSNPNAHMQPGSGQGQGQGPGKNGKGAGSGQGKGYTDHSKQVGKNLNGYTEQYHVAQPTNLFKDEVAHEGKLIQKELLDMSQRLQADTSTLDGLFSSRHKDSAMIQPKVIIKNFFNPHRLMDQVLFKEKMHTYMNVAIFRDVSGSTHGDVRGTGICIHDMMERAISQLYREIPVDITYYLYSSGNVSILEIPYVPWSNYRNKPQAYLSNPLFVKMGGSTNSDAIADVITQQLSEKWLNIIVTDGDLNRLMARDNILGLMKNVFVVSVNSTVEDGLLGVAVKELTDLAKITPVLSTINLDRTL